MKVSARERRHFEAIRRAKEAELEERLREALRAHPIERILEGLELGEAASTDEVVEAALDRRALAQAQLARRGRSLLENGKRDGRRQETS